MPALQRAAAQAVGDQARFTLLGIWLSLIISIILSRSHPLPVEILPAVRCQTALQRAVLANRIGALENPVLPCGQPGEISGFPSFPARQSAGWPPSPVIASGRKLARSSMQERTSSSQSISSKVKVTGPGSASAGFQRLPIGRAPRQRRRERPETVFPAGSIVAHRVGPKFASVRVIGCRGRLSTLERPSSM